MGGRWEAVGKRFGLASIPGLLCNAPVSEKTNTIAPLIDRRTMKTKSEGAAKVGILAALLAKPEFSDSL